MAQQIINTGAAANDNTGDPIRTAFTKANDNFTELYGLTSSLLKKTDAFISVGAGGNYHVSYQDGTQATHANFSTLLSTVHDALAEGEVIGLGADTFVVDSTVTFTKTLQIVGHGNPSTKVRAASGFNDFLLKYGTLTERVGGICRITGVRFEGHSGGSSCSGIEYVNAAEPNIKASEFTGFQGVSVKLNPFGSKNSFWSLFHDTWFVVPDGAIGLEVAGSTTGKTDLFLSDTFFMCLTGSNLSECIVVSGDFDNISISKSRFINDGVNARAIRVGNGTGINIEGGNHFIDFDNIPILFEARGSLTNVGANVIGNHWKGGTRLVDIQSNNDYVNVGPNTSSSGQRAVINHADNSHGIIIDTEASVVPGISSSASSMELSKISTFDDMFSSSTQTGSMNWHVSGTRRAASNVDMANAHGAVAIATAASNLATAVMYLQYNTQTSSVHQIRPRIAGAKHLFRFRIRDLVSTVKAGYFYQNNNVLDIRGDSKRGFGLYAAELTPAWSPTTAYTVGDYVRPTTSNKIRYRCANNGTSGASEPVWPTNGGGVVGDNGMTWTAESIEGTANFQFVTGHSGVASPDALDQRIYDSGIAIDNDWHNLWMLMVDSNNVEMWVDSGAHVTMPTDTILLPEVNPIFGIRTENGNSARLEVDAFGCEIPVDRRL